MLSGMLLAISIQSFVLIDRLSLDVGSGLTALTGETGAGKSILLDALGLVLGGTVNRDLVRKDAKQAVITASFSLTEDDADIWDRLDRWGIPVNREEALVLTRVVPVRGASRAMINGQAVSARNLAELGQNLVEIHAQNSASSLQSVAAHRDLLDQFGGLTGQLTATMEAWRAYGATRDQRAAFERAVQQATEQQDWLAFQLSELQDLAPEPGEAARLTSERIRLLHASKLTAQLELADQALSGGQADQVLGQATRALDGVMRIPGLDDLPADDGLVREVRMASEAVERAMIELAEAGQLVARLVRQTHDDPSALSRIETRLFALRAAARKYRCEIDALPETCDALAAELADVESQSDQLDALRAEEDRLYQVWQTLADGLSAGRKQAARRLEAGLLEELGPLHLDRVRFQACIAPSEPGASGLHGHDVVEFLVETNAGEGFGPLRRIASGGELARFSLALKCALSQAGGARTLIFDEADHGVGGAVAAAIGERLARLGRGRQVLAITHSPQVASSACRQWRIRKTDQADGRVTTDVTQMDDGQRLEEIARMLSGSSITDEARAAASKLLEVA